MYCINSRFGWLLQTIAVAAISTQHAAAVEMLSMETVSLSIEVNAKGNNRFGQPVEVRLSHEQWHAFAAKPATVQLAEVDLTGRVIDSELPFQVDSISGHSGDDDSTENAVILTFIMDGETPRGQSRFFLLYGSIGTEATKTAQDGRALVQVADDVEHEGQPSIQVSTTDEKGQTVVTYLYHKQGCGFASIVDRDGKDWIGYSTAKGHLGEYRGIPNLGWDALPPDNGFGHPGYTTGESQIIRDGPVVVTIHSRSQNRLWECFWDIYPTFARLTVTKVPQDRTYWFLYEGTPGGELLDDDFSVRSGNEKSSLADEWGHDLANPEFAAFTSRKANRTLLLVHLDDDDREDSYYKLGSMTVFGFGRKLREARQGNLLAKTPNRFVISLVETSKPSDLQNLASAAVNALDVRVAPGVRPHSDDRVSEDKDSD